MRMDRRDFVRRAALLPILGSSLLGASGTASIAATPAFPVPRRNGNRRWRIGYAEGLSFINFAGTLEGIVRGLDRQGWISDTSGMPYVDGQSDTKAMWDWLAARDDQYVEFVPDAHFGGLSSAPAEPIVEQLRAGDLDLMIVMGTVAGQKLATDAHTTPTLVFSATNPVTAGFAKSESDSGRDHVWAHMDLSRTTRQLRLFYETFRFKKLGVVYEDTAGGRGVASIGQVEEVAERLGFTLVRRFVDRPTNTRDPEIMERYYAELSRAWTEIAGEADAVYVTFGQWTPDRFPALARILIDRRVPTFSQSGPEEVERGVLMSIARADFRGIGNFGATTVARVLGGAKPRGLPQVYFDTPTIAWNLEVAQRIGFQVPFNALLAADNIYTKITGFGG
ncbi:ABC transporter substrate binding protein [Arenibaculum pallidiluteum]|uniref:ABC transporter substrate binding protein n=1 Tax=Arenibaculum pallidiluteum TaxID=2812559 RepID=UPI001A962AAF|nr:ABC transporter substrate binding protein [Arenibaculum pallidiluteum]